MTNKLPRAREGALETLTVAGGARYRGRVYLADGSRVRVPVPASYTTEERAREYVHAMQELENQHGKLLEKATLERAERARHVDNEKVKPSAAETCTQWHERFLSSRTKVKTRHSRLRWRKWVHPIIGNKPIAKVTSRDIEDVRNALDAAIVSFQRDGRGKGRLMPKSALNVWSVVTTAFRHACKSKSRALVVREDNPAEGVLPPEKGDSRQKDFLRPVEVEALLSCTAVPMEWREAIAVAIYTYVRPGEHWELRVSDLDFDARLIHITRAWDWEDEAVKPPKTKLGIRSVPMEPALVPLLERLVKGRQREELLFPWLRDLNENKVAMKFRVHLRAAGITREALFADTDTAMAVNWRSCRDTGITWLALAGVPTPAIMRRAGHDDVKTSLGYVKVAEDFSGGRIGVPFGPLPKDLVTGVLMATAHGHDRGVISRKAGKTSPDEVPKEGVEPPT